MRNKPLAALALLIPLLAVVLVSLQLRNQPADPGPRPAPWMLVPAVAPNALAPIPPPPVLNPRASALGERLFHDPRLSANGSISCASCHDLTRAGTDSRARAVGIRGVELPVNTPTVFNAALHHTQFHDGRVRSLEEQVAGPLHAPLEMDSSWAHAIKVINDDPAYAEAFGELYAEGVTSGSIAHAIASFERTLLTPDSRFDRFLRGEADALDSDERAGYALFLKKGCASCHQGAAVGGNLFQRFGIMGDYFADRGGDVLPSPGRYLVTGRDADRRVYKVPSLRNVAVTGPYLHDGSVESLGKVVSLMGRYQLGQRLTPGEIDLITAFLHTLTGTYHGAELR